MNRPSPWFERQTPQRSHEERLMTWSQPTWVERNGKLIAAGIGVVAILVALAAIIVGVVGSVLS